MLGAMGTWAIGGLLVVAAAIATLMNWRRSTRLGSAGRRNPNGHVSTAR